MLSPTPSAIPQIRKERNPKKTAVAGLDLVGLRLCRRSKFGLSFGRERLGGGGLFARGGLDVVVGGRGDVCPAALEEFCFPVPTDAIFDPVNVVRDYPQH